MDKFSYTKQGKNVEHLVKVSQKKKKKHGLFVVAIMYST